MRRRRRIGQIAGNDLPIRCIGRRACQRESRAQSSHHLRASISSLAGSPLILPRSQARAGDQALVLQDVVATRQPHQCASPQPRALSWRYRDLSALAAPVPIFGGRFRSSLRGWVVCAASLPRLYVSCEPRLRNAAGSGARRLVLSSPADLPDPIAAIYLCCRQHQICCCGRSRRRGRGASRPAILFKSVAVPR